MDKYQMIERLKKDLRSLLIASKHGLSIKELEHDYRMLVGSPLPVKSVGYRSTMEMVQDMADVVTIQTKADGTINLTGVVNEETKGVAELVSRQKSSSKVKTTNRRGITKPRYHMDLVRRGRIAPVLPASLKSELRDLLSISPLLVSQLETAFYNRFGHSFQYTRYGFYSLLEVLASLSDMVKVTQTRAGSLLMLKTPYNNNTFIGLSSKPVINWSYYPVTPVESPGPCSISRDKEQYSKTKPSKGVSLSATTFATSQLTGPTAASSATVSSIFPKPASTATVSSIGPMPAPTAIVSSIGPKPASTATVSSVGPQPAFIATVSSVSPKPSSSPTVSSIGPKPASSNAVSCAGPRLESSASVLFTGPKPAPFATAPYAAPTPTSASATTMSSGPTPLFSATSPFTCSTAKSAAAPSTGSTPASSATVFSVSPNPGSSKSVLSLGSTPASSATDLFIDFNASSKTVLKPATVPASAYVMPSGSKPATFAIAPSTGPTILDKLFQAAEAEFYASKSNKNVNKNFKTGDSALMETTKSMSCSFPPAEMQDTSGNLLESSPVVETATAEMTCLSTGDSKVNRVKPSMEFSLHEKLDESLRLCLSQKNAGSVLSPELRQQIKNVVNRYAEGLSISKLSDLYKQHIGKNLPFRELGFMSVVDMVGSLGDTLHLENTKDGDWLLFDAEKNCKQNEQEIPLDAVRKQKLHCLPCMNQGSIFGAIVENMASPSEFYIRCYSKDTSEKLEDMMIEMRHCYSNVSDRYVVPDDSVSVGEIYAVCVAGDVWWYRVIVHHIISSEDVKVYYPDFGNLAIVKRKWLRFLKAIYMKLPAQAVPSSLCFVKPAQDQWSNEAMKIFKQYCMSGPLVAIVMHYVLGRLCLLLCDTATDDDVYLHQVLVNQGLAHLIEGPEFYKATCQYFLTYVYFCELKPMLVFFIKDLQNYDTFVNYLSQHSEQPEEESCDPTDPSENNTVPFVNEEAAIIQIVCGCQCWHEIDLTTPSLNFPTKPKTSKSTFLFR
uniref:Tudor domain-containing protein 5 n=1 Tax=Pyxicephalus adspersus TaxID=30357 RepID=A0AAV2ZUC4_PYXAD|nr:TPA: hypothetical protein GDO54_016334 [Pyxicephalus adspersus]